VTQATQRTRWRHVCSRYVHGRIPWASLSSQRTHQVLGSARIWEDVTLEIPAGSQRVAGAVGYRQIVFLKSLIGLLRPERGSIVIDGTDIIECSAKELYEIRTLFGVLFQEARCSDR